jgi:hypothetical protein
MIFPENRFALFRIVLKRHFIALSREIGIVVLNPMLTDWSKQRQSDDDRVRADERRELHRLRHFGADPQTERDRFRGSVGTMVTVILNLPLPCAIGNDYPGRSVCISSNGRMAPVLGGFTYNEQIPQVPDRLPTTSVVTVPMAAKSTTIMGMWSGVRGSRVIIDSPATLTAFS